MYQPKWIGGKEVGKGRRDAAGRYRVIADYLAHIKLDSGFTVLDFGAYGGYFSARLHDELDAVCTAVDDSKMLTNVEGVSTIPERLTASGIRKLGTFDVVLCLSVLHHIKQWRATLRALVDGTVEAIFIETAHPSEILPKAVAHSSSEEIAAEIGAMGGRVLAQTPGYDASFPRPLWVIDRKARETHNEEPEVEDEYDDLDEFLADATTAGAADGD